MSLKDHFQLTLVALVWSLMMTLCTWMLIPAVSWMHDPDPAQLTTSGYFVIIFYFALIFQGPVMGGIWLLRALRHSSRNSSKSGDDI